MDERMAGHEAGDRTGSPSTFNLADLFELVADAIPEREAMVAGARRLTYGDLEARANRLAHHLQAAGVRAGDHVGLQLLNGTEYVEGMLAAFKIRAVPINVNYRYVDAELAHLFDDADLVAVVHHRQFSPRVAAVAPGLPLLHDLIVVEDGSDESPPSGAAAYEDVLAAASPTRDFGPRSGDDIYCAYTGGTTGMPKGVLWRQEDIFFAAMGGGDPLQSGDFITRPEELVDRLPDQGMVTLATPPLMHVSAHWLAFVSLFGGGRLVVTPQGRFDPQTAWSLIAEEKVNVLVIVGDAMARPLADAFRQQDTSSLMVIGSGGAILSPSTRQRLSSVVPNAMIVDGFGASETGTVGSRSSLPGAAGGDDDLPRFTLNEQTTVLDDELRPVVPGSGTIGRLARRGHIPLGYYKDKDKTASTFVEVDDVRWVLPGDMATVEEDGTVVLLGRGSVSINTGGEKVYPEEVESVLKSHPAVFDAVVVGVPDERWGERVVAVVQSRSGEHPTLEEIQSYSRDKMAGYKVPRQVVLVDEVVRSPSGKADYRWARDRASQPVATGKGA
ncbi:MAG TPA: acyl-CoA synthetase [Acidimicrobiales bacterium]|nr:acyl-CoA synthetase [Acidimicrobiales bacterium]